MTASPAPPATAAVRPVPADQAQRDRIERTGLHETLFVEAGAGTGKTHELVERVVHLVLDEGVPLAAVAAITFTEAAAAELRDRIRARFEEELPAATPERRAACRAALAELDEAAIGTLHSFALRILGEHPVEVGLPPRVDVLDEVASQLAFEERWRRFVDQLYDDPAAEQLVTRAWALGIEVDVPAGSRRGSLKAAASVLDDSWDRLDAAADAELPPLPAVDLAPIEPAVEALRAAVGDCRADDDPLCRMIVESALPEADVLLAEPDDRQRLVLLGDCVRSWARKVGNKGQKPNWGDISEARAAWTALGEVAGQVLAGAKDDVLRRLTVRLARFTRAAAEERRAEGHLDFHDLLVLARRLVRTSPAARAALHERYQRLLLDEFQDTDPIQIEVAVLIAAAVEGGPVDRPWHDVATEPGRLFFVGDPKQSIYRFRRADIGLFLAARDAFSGADPTVLSHNFRTVEPVLTWVNHVFGRLMAEEQPGRQAAYRPLSAARTDVAGDHRVVLLGGPSTGTAGELREQEAAAVADAIGRVRDDPDAWPVADGAGGWRRPRMADVTILVPTRTSLRQLEDALEGAAIPYRVATGTLVYDTQEVREALAALRAVDDPGDEIALVAALRSPLYACSDVDLFTWHEAGGRWDHRREPPPGLPDDHPVAAAMAHLRSLWEVRWWHEPSALLDRLLRERGAFALAFSSRRPREVWRRLRFLIDQARAFEEAGGSGVRAFLDWAALQLHEGSRTHEPLLAETDDDAVSILTIHGAKGLEFPITVVSGATTRAGGRRGGVQVLWDGERPELKLGAAAATASFDRLADLEEEMDVHERHRLLYVACTRARDHLVVSTFHKPGGGSYGELLTTLVADEEGQRLCRRLPDLDARADEALGDDLGAGGAGGTAPAPAAGAAPVAPPADHVPPPADDERERWLAEREALVARNAVPRVVSATAIAAAAAAGAAVDGPTTGPVDPIPPPPEAAAGADLAGGGGTDGAGADEGDDGDDGPIPWRRGRAGTAVGRAVHATLQFATDEHDARLAHLATQQAHVEAIPELAGLVAVLARSALRAPSVRAAAVAPRAWKELYVAAPLGARAVEGYVDLLYEAPEGLVLVDYKTDAVRSPAEADAKVARYGLQAATYAAALEASTGLRVVRAVLVFCSTDGPLEREVPDLAALQERVRGLLATG